MKRIGIIVVALTLGSAALAQLADGLYAAFDTSMGGITCRLDYAEAPVTCANFAGLAEGSQNWINPATHSVQNDPFYEGLIFHRVITNFMIQGGCPLGTGTSGPGYAFPDEFSTNLTHHSAGILSMANSGPDSNGSQFFITLNNTDWLDNKHSVFGEVVDGMDVVFDIGAVTTDAGNRPLSDVTIEQIDILRIGTDAENFDPLAQSLPEVDSLHLVISEAASDLEVSATTSNRSKQLVYTSTDLSNWVLIVQNYTQTEEGTWSIPVEANLPKQFFRAIRVFHPQATANQISGHSLEITIGTTVIIYQPEVGGGGSCSLNGNPGTITSWDFDPAYCGYKFVADTIVPISLDFQYATPTNGACDGFYYDSTYGWTPIAGTFTDTPAP